MELFEKCLTKSRSCSNRIRCPLPHLRTLVVGHFLRWQVFTPVVVTGCLLPGRSQQLCALASASEIRRVVPLTVCGGEVPACACRYTCTCVCTYVAQVRVCMSVQVGECVCGCMEVDMYMCAYMYTCAGAGMCMSMHVGTHVYVCMHVVHVHVCAGR